jgi:hypothetical protein
MSADAVDGRPGAITRGLETIRRRPVLWSLLALLAAILLANLIYVVGYAPADPLAVQSGLISSFTPAHLPGSPTIDPNVGVTSQAFGHLAMTDWVHGHVPWWNSYAGLGEPLAGGMQSAALFPFTLWTLLSNGQLWERMMLEAIAGGSTFLLLRRIGLHDVAALAAAIAFALNGTFAWLTNAVFNPIAFLPVMVLGVELIFDAARGDRVGGWWLLAIGAALSVYAGFPEVAYIDGLFAIFWAIWRACCLPRAQLLRYAGGLVAGAVVAVLLAAPLLVAFTDYLPHSFAGGHSTDAYSNVSLAKPTMAMFLMPYLYGPIFAFSDPGGVVGGWWSAVGGYVTTTLLFLALLALPGRARRGLRIALLIFVVLAFARIYHEPPGLGAIFGVLPAMSRVAFYRYAFPALEFAIVVLAAIGLDRVIRARPPLWQVAVAAGVTAVAVVVAVWRTRPLYHALGVVFSEHPYYRDTIIWSCALVAVAAIACLIRSSLVRRTLIALVLVADAGAMFALPELSAPRHQRVDAAPVAFLRSHLGLGRFYTLDPLRANYGSYYRVASLNLNDDPVPKPWKAYVQTHLNQLSDALHFVGTTNGVDEPLTPTPEQELLRNLPGYRAADVRYVLTPPGTALPQSASTFHRVLETPTAWIYRLSGSTPYFSTTAAGCRLSDESRESLTIDCPHPARLVKAEIPLAGWSASVDGHGTSIAATPLGMQAITVPAGRHRVTFSYQPPRIIVGYIAFVLGLLALLLVTPWGASARRRATARWPALSRQSAA